MIVRELQDSAYMLINQHDHALASGEFARHWARKPEPGESAIFAIANHDMSWRDLDRRPLWDPESGKPYGFLEYPIERRIAAYRRGLDETERLDPYAGCLCSMHYTYVVNDSKVEVRFKQVESERQERLKKQLSDEQRSSLNRDLRFLQFFDTLSLFVCFAEGDRGGFERFQTGFTIEGIEYVPDLEDESTLILEPSPFACSFQLDIPYRTVDRSRTLDSGRLKIMVAG